MTTPVDDADIARVKLVDQALDRGYEPSAEQWLLAQLPVGQHARAKRMLAIAQATTAEYQFFTLTLLNRLDSD